MASLVNPFNINGNYPIAGQDNDSQGFRDNFTNIKNNFIFIKQEVEDIQSKVILKSALSGSSLDNNFLGSQVKNIQTKNQSETVYDWGEVGGATATEIQLDLALGNIHKINATGSIKINSVIKNWPAALQYARILLYINIDSVEDTLELPSTLTTDLAGIPGLRTVASSKLITFTDSGDYIFEFSSVDSGTTVFVRELTKGVATFRDPNFYMAGIGGFSTPTLRLGWGNLFALSSTIDTNTKGGNDTFSVRGAVTSYMNHADGGNDPDDMTQAGFSVAKSRTVDPGAGVASPTETVISSGDFIGYFNGLALTADLAGGGTKSYQQMASIGMYTSGSNTSYGLGGNIVISTKRDGGTLAAAITIDQNQNVVLKGNLQVDGTQTIINSTVLTVDDKNIVVAQGNDPLIPAQSNAAGIIVDSVYANILYIADDSGLSATVRDRWHSNKPFTISPTTASTDTTTGALVVGGGLGVAGALNVGGTFGLSSTTEATNTTTAAFAVGGGIAAVKNIIAGGAVFANSTATSSNLASGAFQVQGGAAVKGNLYIGGQSGSGATQTGLYILTTSTSANTSSGALVVLGGAGISGNVYLGAPATSNGVVISSTLNVPGTMLTGANADARSSTAALRVKGGSIFESNVVFGIGSSSGNIGPGRVFIDNGTQVTLGDIGTGGLVLGNGTSLVGASISGDMNIGTSDSGTVYILNKENAIGTPISAPLTPFVPSKVTVGLDQVVKYGSITTKGGMNVFNDVYIGQPHGEENINNAGVWSGSPNTYQSVATNPYYGTPEGAASGNVYLQSGARGLSATSGALVIKSVILADGSTSEGGAGIAGNLWVNRAGFIGTLGASSNYGNLVAASSTESTQGGAGATGSLVVLGGAGIVSKLNVGGVIAANSAVASTSKTTGAIVIPSTGGLGVGGGITAGNISLDAGTASQESLLIPTGTLLTSPKVGAVEFSGGVWYATPAASSRGILPTTHTYMVSGNAAINNGVTITSTGTFYGVFGGASGTGTIGAFSATAATTYEVELRLVIAGTGGAIPTSTMSFTFGGTATYSFYDYQVQVLNVVSGSDSVTAVPTAPVMSNFLGTSTMPTATTGVIVPSSAVQNRTIFVKGVIRVNAAGTVIPQIAVNASMSPVILSSAFYSYYKMTPVGGTSTVSVGNFSAT